VLLDLLSDAHGEDYSELEELFDLISIFVHAEARIGRRARQFLCNPLSNQERGNMGDAKAKSLPESRLS
jgi:hypothetical protein